MSVCAVPGCPNLRPCAVHPGAKRNGSTRAWRNTRQRILGRDGYRCQQCGAPAEHVDHITPLAAGGTDDASNLRALCANCNLSKG